MFFRKPLGFASNARTYSTIIDYYSTIKKQQIDSHVDILWMFLQKPKGKIKQRFLKHREVVITEHAFNRNTTFATENIWARAGEASERLLEEEHYLFIKNRRMVAGDVPTNTTVLVKYWEGHFVRITNGKCNTGSTRKRILGYYIHRDEYKKLIQKDLLVTGK